MPANRPVKRTWPLVGALGAGFAYAMLLDRRYPAEAVAFLRRAVVDPADADELGPFRDNLYNPLGTGGLFDLVGDEARPWKSGTPISMSVLAKAVRAGVALGSGVSR